LIFDRRLLRSVPGFRRWVGEFSASDGVTAGEPLKDLRAFPRHCERILRRTAGLSARRLTVVAVGGGSVGDFGGFVASVLKRGVRLVHVPTTWLAAIDSAHGGKTALNVSGGKNQIGTFYPADEIYIVSRVLEAQPAAREAEACGELAKIALLDGGTWVRRLEKERPARDRAHLLLKYLPDAIGAKRAVVRRDPLEKTGARQILNLGHTLGHVLEAALGLSHGEAVAQGTFFALAWSRELGFLSARDEERAQHLLRDVLGLRPLVETGRYRGPGSSRARRLLSLDKKKETAGQVTFIFLEAFGRARRRPVTADELLRAAQARKWIGR